MSEEHAPEDFIYSMAQAVVIFGPCADFRKEYKAYDIAKHLNPGKESRRRNNIISESDLAAGLCDSTIRNSLDRIFPLLLEFKRHNEGRDPSTKYFYKNKIKFLGNINGAGFTVDSLAAAIAGNIEAVKSKKRKRPIKAPAAPASSASAASPAPAPPAAFCASTCSSSAYRSSSRARGSRQGSCCYGFLRLANGNTKIDCPEIFGKASQGFDQINSWQQQRFYLHFFRRNGRQVERVAEQRRGCKKNQACV